MHTPVRILTALAIMGSALPAQAEEELSRRPYPVIRNDEAMVHAGYSAGFSDEVRGVRMQCDYFHWLNQSVSLDLQAAIVSGKCPSGPSICNHGSGTALDLAVGAVWRFRTQLPVVPYAKVDAGPLFLFPEASRGGAGILVRGGLGAHYYFNRRFGIGAEVSGAGGVTFFGVAGHDVAGIGDVSATVGVALLY